MLRAGRAFRGFACVWAVLQFALPAALTIADGLASDAAVAAADHRHIESGTGQECAPVHAADCGVCRFLSGSHAIARGSDAAPWLLAGPIQRPVIRRAHASDAFLSLRRARAPPTV